MNNTVLTDLNNAESYCSIKGDTREALVAMYNAINSPDHKLSDFVGKKLNIKDISIERVENMNDEWLLTLVWFSLTRTVKATPVFLPASTPLLKSWLLYLVSLLGSLLCLLRFRILVPRKVVRP